MGAHSVFYGISASEKYFFYTFTTLVKGLSEFKMNVYGYVHPTPGKYAPNILVLANSLFHLLGALDNVGTSYQHVQKS